MRILIGCDWFLKYAVNQAVALADQGVSTTLVCRDHAKEFGGDSTEYLDAIQRAERSGVTVLRLTGRVRDPKGLRSLAQARSAVARFSPHVVHVHELADPRILPMIPRRVPIVVTVHDPVPHPGQPLLEGGLVGRSIGRLRNGWRGKATALVVHSERLLGATTVAENQLTFVIPHGLNVQPRPLLPPETPTVGLFGRLEPYKGLDVLAAAMPYVWAVQPDTRIVIAGRGPCSFPLDDPRVTINQRYVPEDEIEHLLAGLTMLVLPYTEASQTGVGSEAISYGLPIVVTRLGGLPELALDDYYCCQPNDPIGLADAVLQHLDDDVRVRERVLAHAGRSSWTNVARASIDMYEQVLRALELQD
jgi:glycosyltransferase involved in cell wall biosynthesis